MPLDWKQLVTWGIAFACGGLGGSLFTQWYVNRATWAEYTLNRTMLGTDETDLVPDFHVSVGGQTFDKIYIYKITVRYKSGPELEKSDLGITLPDSDIKFISHPVTEPPGYPFTFTCAPFNSGPIASGTSCALGRLSPSVGDYAVSFAINKNLIPKVTIDGKNANIQWASWPGRIEPTLTQAVILIIALGFAVSLALVAHRRFP